MSAWESIKETVGSVAPMAGSMLAGPAGGAVGAMIASALGVDKNPDSVAKAIRSDPQAAIKLRQIESQLEQTRLEVRGQVVQAEATGESWLQRNWRPLTMVWFSALIVATGSATRLTTYLKRPCFHCSGLSSSALVDM